MCTSFVALVSWSLSLDERALAARLGVSVFAIRQWRRREPPPYAVLALAALDADLDAEEVRKNLTQIYEQGTHRRLRVRPDHAHGNKS